MSLYAASKMTVCKSDEKATTMLFSVRRTSIKGNTSPLDGTVLMDIPNLYRPGETIQVWTLEIDSIPQLLALAKEHDLVVSNGYGDLPSVEIYDNYRE